MDAVSMNNFSVSGASRAFNVPETTLYENLKKKKLDVPFVSQSLIMCVHTFIFEFVLKVPRQYIRNNPEWQRAIKLVKIEKWSVNAASRVCNIPRTT